MTNASNRLQEGYLVIADISGYTAFLTGTEMEHAQEIMEELIGLILDHVKPPYKFVKLEGDAVFFHAPGQALSDGRLLMDALERCYFDFAEHLVNMHRSTTCQCAACRAIPTLDLKFIAHYGNYIIQRLAGVEDLAGTDVILLHRLLKNEIVEKIGYPAYMFVSQACLSRIKDKPAELAPYTTHYEHIGEVQGGVRDLKAVLKSMREARRMYIGDAESDFGVEIEIPAPVEVVWDYLVDPAKNVLWQGDMLSMDQRPNAEGKVGIGATAHCAHGSYSMLHEYLDWQPNRYFTEQIKTLPGARTMMAPPHPMICTYELVPIDAEHTRLIHRNRSTARNRFYLMIMSLMVPALKKMFLRRYTTMSKLIVEDSAKKS